MDIDVRDMPYLVDVTEVTPLDGYRLHVTFDDGNSGTFDMTPWLGFPVFEPLRDESMFRRARIDYGTVVWDDGIDIAPERLWTDCIPDGEDWRPRLLPAKYFN